MISIGCLCLISLFLCAQSLGKICKSSFYFRYKSLQRRNIVETRITQKQARHKEIIYNKYFYFLSPRFKSFCSSRNSVNPTLRPNLRPNSNDSMCYVIDSCQIFGSTEGVRPNENKTDLGWFQWRIRLNVESSSHQNPELCQFLP